MPSGKCIRTSEHCRNLSIALRGNKNALGCKRSDETLRKMRFVQSTRIRKPFSEEHKKNLGIASKRMWQSIDKKEMSKKISQATKGRVFSKEHLKNLSFSHLGKKGKDASNWRGGITSLYYLIAHLLEYKQWRFSIFKRDNFTCQECGQVGGRLEAHHLRAFVLLVRDFLQMYSQFSPFEDKETLVRLAFTYKPFWNIGNGKTLCEDCHKITDTYLKSPREKEAKK